MATLTKLSINLWFDSDGEEAAKFYTSIFKNASIDRISRYGKAGYEVHKRPEGSVMTVEFTLEGQSFVALNGGPEFKFNEAVSVVINCEDQKEIDYYWEKLGAGGDPSAQQCGWLKDKFGMSWQVTPTILSDMAASKDAEKKDRAMAAMMEMKKLDIDALQRAYDGELVNH